MAFSQAALAAAFLLAGVKAGRTPFVVQVLDQGNGWPVCAVELSTNNGVSFWTDNAGRAAFDLPELMGRETWLAISSDGYEVPADGFGNRGFRVTPKWGSSTTIRIRRTNIAKRLGRITGAGIFAESQKAGLDLDWKESGVLGSDSVQVAPYKGRIMWAWGDTSIASYPLGLFHASGAATPAKPLSRFTPPLKLALDYYKDGKGAPRNVANLFPNDPGPTWISGYTTLKDQSGTEKLIGCWMKIEPPMNAYRIGLCMWNDSKASFENVSTLWDKKSGMKEPTILPLGHPIRWRDKLGVDWLMFGDPFPTIKMKPDLASWRSPTAWQKLDPPDHLLDAKRQSVKPHRGSIAWSDFRHKWVAIFCEVGGKPSVLGEIWYTESESPLGPWGRAVKVVSHKAYSFYNPRIHPELTPKGSPILLFEGTYTQSFSSAPARTPRYDYNQIMYRLDLDDPALDAARRP